MAIKDEGDNKHDVCSIVSFIAIREIIDPVVSSSSSSSSSIGREAALMISRYLCRIIQSNRQVVGSRTRRLFR